MTVEDQVTIRTAWYDAQKLRPYKADPEVLQAITPPGGAWQTIVKDGGICRSVMWNTVEVALVNPEGDLDDATEGDIAMALRAQPVVDMALRVILKLARDQGDPVLIAKIAETAIAYIETPAPKSGDG